MNQNYSATVVRISNIRPHTNADRLVVTNIFGNNVIVGKETKVGDVGLYFPLESQIGLEFAQANDLIRRKDENGKPTGGMFDENRRVRAQTLRGEKSMGFWIPIESLVNLQKFLSASGDEFKLMARVITTNDFVVGAEIDTLGNFVISQKYIPRRTRLPGAGGAKKAQQPRESRILSDQFRFHTDTAQLGKNMHKINPWDVIVLTWKMHGTSAIAARVRVKKQLTWLEKLLSFLVCIIDTKYDYVYASRRVIKNEFEESKQHYYDSDLWTELGKEYFEGKLRQGETVYYEIVGYTKNGGAIQNGFDYGCLPTKTTIVVADQTVVHPQNKIFVYRITQTAPDGSVVELQWNQVKERSKEIGVETVPEIYYGKPLFQGFNVSGGISGNQDILPIWQTQYLDWLKNKYVYDQDSQFCVNKVPEEGIVLRKEGSTIEAYKLKSFRFLEHETKQLDKGEVDIETEQSEYGGTSDNS